MLLDYERKMIIDMYEGSSLLVSGRGMISDKVFLAFLKIYSTEQLLVLVLNCSKEESKFFIDQLKSVEVSKVPILLDSDSQTKNHFKIYSEGGVIFLSSQILVVDYLMGRIPGQLVRGVMVYRADTVTETSQEAFALRLFKENNHEGFVKAFSDNSISLSTGFSQLDRVMSVLQVRNVYLWPRFTLDVVTTLNNCKPNIEEVALELSPAGIICQLSLLDIVRQMLADLKLESPLLNIDELTVENAITPIFDGVIRLYVEPIWNQISKESRRLVFQIKEMRRLIYMLIEQDPVNFYILLETMKGEAISHRSSWVTYKAADSLISAAKSRLCKESKVDIRKLTNTKELDIEVPEKWNKLLEILENIKKDSTKVCSRKILVIVKKEATAMLLTKLFKIGSKATLKKIASKFLMFKKWNPLNTKKATNKGSSSDKGGKDEMEEEDGVTRSDGCIMIDSSNLVIHYGGGESPRSRLHSVIRASDPRDIILFDPRMTDIREIENFQAELMHVDEDDLVNVYVLMYADSVEEQRYLTMLRNEKEAFQALINAKASLLLPEFCYDNPRSVYGSSTRFGGVENLEAKVIVDMREFRSALPSLLHRKGYKIEPLTIDVGDYILAPHICVERKSVSDFIGSLNNGRLYHQCCAMTRLYPLSILLIEFSAISSSVSSSKNTFSLFIGKNTISEDMSSRDILSRLALLTIHFQKLRILWSHSPYTTVDLFTDLKIGRPEPSSDKLPHNLESTHADQNIYNEDVVDTLLKIPGINWKNHGVFLRKIDSLIDLLKLSEQEIVELLENKVVAHKIFSFLHDSKRTLIMKSDEATRKNFKKPRFDLVKTHK